MAFLKILHYIAIVFLAAVVIGFLAGIYPALVLSSFKPVTVLKGRFATGTRGILLRKGLLLSQFTISIGLIIATIVVYNQMKYMRNQDLGFSKDQMMVIDTYGDPAKNAFKQSLARNTQCKINCYFIECSRWWQSRVLIQKLKIKKVICR